MLQQILIYSQNPFIVPPVVLVEGRVTWVDLRPLLGLHGRRQDFDGRTVETAPLVWRHSENIQVKILNLKH